MFYTVNSPFDASSHHHLLQPMSDDLLSQSIPYASDSVSFDDADSNSNRTRSNTLNSMSSETSTVSLENDYSTFPRYTPHTKPSTLSVPPTDQAFPRSSTPVSIPAPSSRNPSFHSQSTPKRTAVPTSRSPSSDSDSEDSCILQNSRASTPPTPVCSSLLELNKLNGHPSSYFYSQYEFLQLVEPSPAPPPDYTTLAPGGCPKFPVFECSVEDKLPDYTASVYKIGVVSRKMEWLSPYEPSPHRSWKSVIIELNSTQLNVYSIPSSLEHPVANFHDDRDLTEYELKDLKSIRSGITTNNDLQFYNYCRRLDLLGDSKKLVRTYSLQHAKIGLATDYKKKPYVLRLRIESEQVLFSFSGIQDLIDWNAAINIGKDIALDLNEREVPRYRTVPRRRRRNPPASSNTRSNFDSNSYGSSSSRRRRSSSDPSRIKGTLSKFKNRFAKKGQPNPNADARAPQACVEREEEPYHSSHEDYQEDVDMADLQVFVDEEEDDDEEERDDFEVSMSRQSGNFHPIFTAPIATYSKWNPYPEVHSEYKYYKNCLRCIKPLTMEDSWVSRSVVKPTTLSPLNFAYLSKIKYCPPQANSISSSKSSSFASLSSMNSSRGRSLSFKDSTGFNLPDSVLTKIPDHFLKEYFVGTHGLIPKDVGNLIDQ